MNNRNLTGKRTRDGLTSTNNMTVKKVALIEAMVKCKGIVTAACNMAGVNRKTFYDYCKADEAFNEIIHENAEMAIDFVEGKLFEKIDGVFVEGKGEDGQPNVYKTVPSDTAIIFYLKTKAKKRGYIESQVVEVTDTRVEFILPIGFSE